MKFLSILAVLASTATALSIGGLQDNAAVSLQQTPNSGNIAASGDIDATLKNQGITVKVDANGAGQGSYVNNGTSLCGRLAASGTITAEQYAAAQGTLAGAGCIAKDGRFWVDGQVAGRAAALGIKVCGSAAGSVQGVLDQGLVNYVLKGDFSNIKSVDDLVKLVDQIAESTKITKANGVYSGCFFYEDGKIGCSSSQACNIVGQPFTAAASTTDATSDSNTMVVSGLMSAAVAGSALMFL